jgi:hypothetical protein
MQLPSEFYLILLLLVSRPSFKQISIEPFQRRLLRREDFEMAASLAALHH